MTEFWKAVADKANRVTAMRKSTRYPFTYAYDFIREAGLADSRAAASVWVDLALEMRFKDDPTISKESFCAAVAEQAIDYLVSLDILEEIKKGNINKLLDLNVPAITTEVGNG